MQPSQRLEMTAWRRPVAMVLGIGYLALLLDLTLLICPVRGPHPRHIVSVRPFANIAHYLRTGGREFAINVAGNLAAFAPVGLLLPWLMRPGRATVAAVFGASLVLSGTIEGLQFLSGRRVADVDDLILNVGGGLLGLAAVRFAGAFGSSQREIIDAEGSGP